MLSLFRSRNNYVPFLILSIIIPMIKVCQAAPPRPPFNSSSISPIVVLNIGPIEIATLGGALQTLGYTHAGDKDVTSLPRVCQDDDINSSTYTILPLNQLHRVNTSSCPETKFILPTRKSQAPCATEHKRVPSIYGWFDKLDKSRDEINREKGLIDSRHLNYQNSIDSVQNYFGEQELEDRLLVIDIDVSKAWELGSQWEDICKFLELGYSIIERCKLSAFPTNQGCAIS